MEKTVVDFRLQFGHYTLPSIQTMVFPQVRDLLARCQLHMFLGQVLTFALGFREAPV